MTMTWSAPAAASVCAAAVGLVPAPAFRRPSEASSSSLIFSRCRPPASAASSTGPVRSAMTVAPLSRRSQTSRRYRSASTTSGGWQPQTSVTSASRPVGQCNAVELVGGVAVQPPRVDVDDLDPLAAAPVVDVHAAGRAGRDGAHGDGLLLQDAAHDAARLAAQGAAQHHVRAERGGEMRDPEPLPARVQVDVSRRVIGALDRHRQQQRRCEHRDAPWSWREHRVSCRPSRLCTSPCRSPASDGAAASVNREAASCGEPSASKTRPPASRTSSRPAVTSHGRLESIAVAFRRPAASQARSSAAEPCMRTRRQRRASNEIRARWIAFSSADPAPTLKSDKPDDGLAHLARVADVDRAAVAPGARSGAGPEALAQERCVDDPKDRLAIDDERERDRAQRAVAGEVDGAVDRIEHPARRAVRRAALLLADEADPRSGRLQRGTDGALDRQVEVGGEVAVALGIEPADVRAAVAQQLRAGVDRPLGGEDQRRRVRSGAHRPTTLGARRRDRIRRRVPWVADNYGSNPVSAADVRRRPARDAGGPMSRTEQLFVDRVDAGRRLAGLLEALSEEHPVIVALPRGGVPVAAQVAGALRSPLQILVVRKLGAPFNPELALGAIAEGGTAVVNRNLTERTDVTEEQLQEILDREQSELRRRATVYRSGQEPLDVRGRTVIVVDDGMATGLTVLAAVRALRARGAQRIVVAVPVASTEAVSLLDRAADAVVCHTVPEQLSSVGQWYRDFDQVSDTEVIELLRADARHPSGHPVPHPVEIPAGEVVLHADLTCPPQPRGAVLFAHGSGSSRRSPRNRAVAATLQRAGFATLLLDLLTEDEARHREPVFDIPLLTRRVGDAIRWAQAEAHLRDAPIGLFGASTGAAAAVRAAADAPEVVRAVVSRGGRVDLATDRLGVVRAPTLMIVGSRDRDVLALNRRAAARLGAPHRVAVVQGAGHLFEEPGTLDTVAKLAADWFAAHLAAAPPIAAAGAAR